MVRVGDLDQEGGDEGQDGVEFRVGGKDHGFGLDIVSLSHSDDTVCANLALTDAGEQADWSPR